MTILREMGAPLSSSVRDPGAPHAVRRRRSVLALLCLAAATVMVLDAGDPFTSPLKPVRSAVGTVMSPAQQAGNAVWKPVEDLKKSVADGSALQAENARLREANAKLSAASVPDTVTEKRAAELTKLLGLAGASGYGMTPAQVVGYATMAGVGDTVTLDAGTADGVQANMTVLAPEGLVGRVVSATADSATVLLITDQRSSVGARLEKTNALGFINGQGGAGTSATLSYSAIDPRTKPVVGQRLVTWGSKDNAPYVPGIPIGVVTEVKPLAGAMASVATVKPFITTSSLDVVAVVTGPTTRNPRDTLLGGAK